MPPIKTIEGLAIDPRTGGSIPNTGCGDNDAILVRAAGDGVVANNPILISKENNNGQLPGGIIDISGVPLIGLFFNISYVSLADVSIYVEFSNGLYRKGFHYLTTGALAAGVVTVSKAEWKMLAAVGGPLVIPIQNPGSNQMRISMSSTGVVTSSYALVLVARGWGFPKMMGV